MSQENTTILIPANTMQALLTSILSKEGFTNEQALQCSTVFTNNSVDGIATHGINGALISGAVILIRLLLTHRIPCPWSCTQRAACETGAGEKCPLLALLPRLELFIAWLSWPDLEYS